MKTIMANYDDLYYVIDIHSTEGGEATESAVIMPSDLDTFIIKIYTTDESKALEYDKSDIADTVLHVNASDLGKLKSGALKMRFIIGIADDNYDDGEFTSTAERLTGYFLSNKNYTEEA